MYAVWGSICVLLRLDSTMDNLNLKTTDLSLLMSMKFLAQWLESQSCIFENDTCEQESVLPCFGSMPWYFWILDVS